MIPIIHKLPSCLSTPTLSFDHCDPSAWDMGSGCHCCKQARKGAQSRALCWSLSGCVPSVPMATVLNVLVGKEQRLAGTQDSSSNERLEGEYR